MAPLDAATFRRTVRTLAAIPETCLPGEGSTPFVVPSGWSPLAVDSAGRRDRSVHVGRTRLVPAAAIAEYIALLEREAECAQRFEVAS